MSASSRLELLSGRPLIGSSPLAVGLRHGAQLPSCAPRRSPWTARRWSLARTGSPRSTCSTAGGRRYCMRSTFWISTARICGCYRSATAKAKRARLLARPPPTSCSVSMPTRKAPWCSGTPASSGRVSCRSGSARPIGQGRLGTESRSRTPPARRWCTTERGIGDGTNNRRQRVRQFVWSKPLMEGRRRLWSGDPNFPAESWGSKSVNPDSEPCASRGPPIRGE
jgi:hypothetical protein